MHQSASLNLINALTYKYTRGVIYLISSIFYWLWNPRIPQPGSWNRQHYGQIINPTEELISVNLFKILCVVTWLLMESVRRQNVIGSAHFGTLTQCLFSSSHSAGSAYYKK